MNTGCRPEKGPSGTRRSSWLENKLLADTGKLGSERSQLLKSHCSEILKKTKLLHGASKEARKFELHFGEHLTGDGRPDNPGLDSGRLGGRREDGPERRPCHR